MVFGTCVNERPRKKELLDNTAFDLPKEDPCAEIIEREYYDFLNKTQNRRTRQ